MVVAVVMTLSLNTTDDVTFNDVDVDGTLTVDPPTVAGTGSVAFNSGNTLTLEATDRVEVTNQNLKISNIYNGTTKCNKHTSKW